MQVVLCISVMVCMHVSYVFLGYAMLYCAVVCMYVDYVCMYVVYVQYVCVVSTYVMYVCCMLCMYVMNV